MSRLEDLRKLKDIPVANTRLYKETAMQCKVSPKQVEECVNILSKFIAHTIRAGAFETVMIPKFGKFKVKVKKLQRCENEQVRFRIPNIEPKTLQDETIRD